MSVAGDTRFPDRAILSNDAVQLAQLEHNMTKNANFANQRAFWHYGSDETLYWTYVTFNGDYPNLTGNGDLYVAYSFYCKPIDIPDGTLRTDCLQITADLVLAGAHLPLPLSIQ